MPKWFHSPSSPFADDKTWSTNLIKIICTIKEIPPQRPTPPEFTFDLCCQCLRGFDCSDSKLTKILCKSCLSWLPQCFQIVPLPNKISSWLTSLLQRLPVREQLREALTRTMLGHGTNSPCPLEPSALAMMSSSTSLQDPSKVRSLAPFPWLSGKDGFLQQLMTPWLWELSKVPSWIYL
jgi:hypothetical protein